MMIWKLVVLTFLLISVVFIQVVEVSSMLTTLWMHTTGTCKVLYIEYTKICLFSCRSSGVCGHHCRLGKILEAFFCYCAHYGLVSCTYQYISSYLTLWVVMSFPHTFVVSYTFMYLLFIVLSISLIKKTNKDFGRHHLEGLNKCWCGGGL